MDEKRMVFQRFLKFSIETARLENNKTAKHTFSYCGSCETSKNTIVGKKPSLVGHLVSHIETLSSCLTVLRIFGFIIHALDLFYRIGSIQNRNV